MLCFCKAYFYLDDTEAVLRRASKRKDEKNKSERDGESVLKKKSTGPRRITAQAP